MKKRFLRWLSKWLDFEDIAYVIFRKMLREKTDYINLDFDRSDGPKIQGSIIRTK